MKKVGEHSSRIFAKLGVCCNVQWDRVRLSHNDLMNLGCDHLDCYSVRHENIIGLKKHTVLGKSVMRGGQKVSRHL